MIVTWGCHLTFPYIHILYPQFGSSLHYSTSSPILLEMTLTGFNASYSHMCRNYINHIHPPQYPPSPIINLPLSCLFHIVLVSIHCSVEFCLGILPVNILYFNQCNPLYYSSLLFLRPPVLFYSFQRIFFVSCSFTDVIYFNIIHFLSFFSFFLILL
jgi:hypothetical protein